MQSAFVSLGGSFVTINGAYMPRPPIDPPTELRVVARDGSVPTRRFYIRIISRGAARDAHAFWNPELQVVEVVQVNVTDKVASGPRTQTASYASTERIVLNWTEIIVYDIMLPSPIIPMQMQSIAFSFPVVPQGQARIRTQVSAAHSREDLAFAIRAFAEVKQEFGL